MNAAAQKRMLTGPKSKLAKADVEKLKLALASDGAWETLPLEVREQLYALVPPPAKGANPHNPDVNPMNTSLQPWIERGLEKWHAGLKDGRHTKQGKANLAKAQRMRMEGKFAKPERRESDEDGASVEVPKNEHEAASNEAVEEKDGNGKETDA